ncbi:hypothetical protein V7S43_014364 [Phytophthora oleae]|uniref:Uncharacterized protein n=1 Tax=Phytophthora oleae TaxID=2107226 RepID=A0ABD3F550_9STRA
MEELTVALSVMMASTKHLYVVVTMEMELMRTITTLTLLGDVVMTGLRPAAQTKAAVMVIGILVVMPVHANVPMMKFHALWKGLMAKMTKIEVEIAVMTLAWIGRFM